MNTTTETFVDQLMLHNSMKIHLREILGFATSTLDAPKNNSNKIRKTSKQRNLQVKFKMRDEAMSYCPWQNPAVACVVLQLAKLPFRQAVAAEARGCEYHLGPRRVDCGENRAL